MFDVALMILAGAATGSAGTFLAMRRRTESRREDGVAAALPVPGVAAPPARSTLEPPTVGDLRRDAQARIEEAEASADRELMAAYLRDVRDQLGAEEVVFWRWDPARATLHPGAWSSAATDRPRHFRLCEWGPLVQWAAQERLVQTAGGEESSPEVAVAPIGSDERLQGVLSASAGSGMSIGKGALREWMPRHAAHLSRLSRELERRRRYGRAMRQGQALLQATEQLRGHRSPEALTAALCATSIDVTSASQAALVRWHAEAGTGEVQFATAELGVGSGFAVGPDSLVARSCVDGLTVVLEDAAHLQAGEPFGPGDRFPGADSAAIVPIVREQVCIGAVVITAAAVGAISHEEARHVGLLAAVAGSSLELIWESAEVDRRARVDALTGLANRRQFDVELQRILAETDRFGGSASLVLVDVDHFKRVNDTHGHRAGDRVLRRVARVLAEGVRAVDVCARYGGEEMAILLPQTTAAGARELADRLRQGIEQLRLEAAGEPIRVTASFGVASYPETVTVRDGLVPAADRALYGAKADGRNCVRSAGGSRRPA